MHGETIVKNLPARPNLDHLRRQAKALLEALQSGNKAAVSTFLKYLPAANGLTGKQLLAAGFRLADAQSTVARSTGFANWPQLARHVEQLRSLAQDITVDANCGRTPPVGIMTMKTIAGTNPITSNNGANIRSTFVFKAF